ncbi:MAG: hypothetical protein GDA56_07255 [Hormoscilla sp. GM7CHS1pb]|nr:hypothetical protein [Hormoscilla sp. GM7CHS1pb]
MKQILSLDYAAQLRACVERARDISDGAKASVEFAQLCDRLGAENPQVAELLDILWKEFLAANRSATFWQQICDVEKELSERMAQTNLQLKQEYLRLMQEQ